MTEVRLKTREFRRQLSDIAASARAHPAVLLKHGEPAAVLISIEDYRELLLLRRGVYTLTPLRS